ncbi:MAG TPA: MGMT family protein [Acidimicrobiia bacterium]
MTVHPDFESRVIATIRDIPPGEVMSYGEVAMEAGFPGAARAVGTLLRRTDETLPWWRVVGAGDRITSPHPDRQARLLSEEGWVQVGATLRRA